MRSLSRSSRGVPRGCPSPPACVPPRCLPSTRQATRSLPVARRSTTRADIERLTTVLEQERTVRQQKEQYSALARRIHAYPSRGDTQAEIGRLNEEIATLEQESEQVASALELRSKRFAGFMHALHDMQLLLQESEAVPMAE